MQGSGESKILFDTYAWIEYFRGSKEGETVKGYVESDVAVFTPTIVIAELSDKYRRAGKDEEWEENRRRIVELRSQIVNLSLNSADTAGKIKKDMRKRHSDFPLADGMILATTREMGCTVLTGDKHIRNLDEAINLKKQSCNHLEQQ